MGFLRLNNNGVLLVEGAYNVNVMKLNLHIARGRHNLVHPILLSIDDEQPILSGVAPRGLGILVKAGFSETEVANATKALVEEGTAVLEGVDIDETYVRHYFAAAC